MSAFTPGPWSAKHIAGNNFAVQCFDIRGMFGDKPHVYPIFNRDESAIDGGYVYTSPANARLIAAAPELYEALRQLASNAEIAKAYLQPDADLISSALFDTICQAETALRKVRGEQGGDQ